MGELNETVSLEIRGHLARLQLTRSEAAEALGVSSRAMTDLLGNRRTWRVDEIDKVAEWLEVNPEDLFFPKRDGADDRSHRQPPKKGAADDS
ncbi:MAG: helix-turn-helix domain-containing protein [Segniliparus sp.]|uniref:helix-turn-helix domain-containing protein n=1 Tax=Segniliparus sp. TaxID=2804064 RepID=UPI003F418338